MHELPFGYYLSRRLVILPEIFFAGVKVRIVSPPFFFSEKNRKKKERKETEDLHFGLKIYWV